MRRCSYKNRHERMQTLHLFAGAGGGLLADLILGHTPIGAVELDPYCCRVLRERAADGWFPELRVHEGDVRLFDPSEYRGRVDCLHAGFPCQPHSVAGKREGEADERNLWPDTARIIGELRPRFVLLENVPGIVSNGYAAVVVGELSSMGYDARWAIISAADAGAPHRRERWWCLAELTDSLRDRRESDNWRESVPIENRDGAAHATRREVKQPRITGDGDVADPISKRFKDSQGGGAKYECSRNGTSDNSGSGSGEQTGWAVEPNVGRMVDGVPFGVDRLKALGNAQVPIQAALAWHLLGGPI